LRVITDINVNWVPCHHDMARPHIADGGDGFRCGK